MKLLKFFFIVLLFAAYLCGKDTFKIVETWQPGDEVVGSVSHSIINEDGNIIATFYMSGNRVITPKKIIKFAPRGQGPGDLTDMRALFHYNNDIAFVERPEKAKIFKKEGDTYKIKEIVWLKRGRYIHVIQNGLFCDNKWFLAGFEMLDFDKKKEIQYVSFLKIYDINRKPLKNLIKKELDKPQKIYEMEYFVVNYNDRVFFLSENELKVHIIDLKELEVKKEVKLEIPGFYKKMPENFYSWVKPQRPNQSFKRYLDQWKTSYSSINKVIVEGKFLILQMRTCNDKLKKFALLFYNADNFKLEKTIFINDLLLGAKDGKYYFFANGDPGRDEEAEDFIIHIYSFGDKNEKK